MYLDCQLDWLLIPSKFILCDRHDVGQGCFVMSVSRVFALVLIVLFGLTGCKFQTGSSSHRGLDWLSSASLSEYVAEKKASRKSSKKSSKKTLLSSLGNSTGKSAKKSRKRGHASTVKSGKKRRKTAKSGKKNGKKSEAVASRGRLHGQIARYARAEGVPVALAHAIIKVESNYRVNARGSVGEIGLMQIRLQTARLMGYRGSAKNLYNPSVNLKWGMKYLGKARKLAGGNMCGTILRYNAGHGAKRMNKVSANYCGKIKSILRA